jgi:hypothetical protein
MAPTMDIDPVSAVFGLLDLLATVIMLVMKIHKACGPRARRIRRHHQRRRTGDLLPLRGPPRQYHNQCGQSTQPAQQHRANNQQNIR